MRTGEAMDGAGPLRYLLRRRDRSVLLTEDEGARDLVPPVGRELAEKDGTDCSDSRASLASASPGSTSAQKVSRGRLAFDAAPFAVISIQSGTSPPSAPSNDSPTSSWNAYT